MSEREKLLKEIAYLVKERNTANDLLGKRSRQLFELNLADLFAAHPIVSGITWEQLTPYFNDGDVCTFRVNEPRLHVAAPTLKTDPETDRYLSEFPKKEIGVKIPRKTAKTYSFQLDYDYRWDPNPDYTPEHAAAEEAFSSFWETIDEEFLESGFGDHKRITVTRSDAGLVITVDDYIDHD